MVLVTAAEEEQHHQRLVIACGDHCPNMAQSADLNRSPSTTPGIPSTSPLPPSSSPSTHHSERASPENSRDVLQMDLKKSPRSDLLHTDFKKSPRTDSDGSEDCGNRATTGFVRKTSPVAFMAVKEEAGEERCKQFVVSVKQEQDMDAPLDFSIKRREVVSDAVSTDAHMTRPAGFSSPSSRLSPDTSLLQQQQQQQHAFSSSPQLNNGNSDVDDDVSQSPSRSPVADGAKQSSPAPSAASLAALRLLSDGSGAGVTPAVLSAVLAQNGSVAAGSLSGVPGLLGDAHKLQTAGGGKAQRPFKAYPKEVLKMPLGYLGLPGVSPFPGMDPSYVQSLPGVAVLPEELMAMYKQQTDLLKEREKQLKSISKKGSKSPPSSAAVSPPSSVSASNGRNHVMRTSPPPPPSSISLQTSAAAGTHSDSSSPGVTAGLRSSPAPLAHSPSLMAAADASPSALPTSSASPLVSSTSSGTTAGGSRKRPRNFPDSQKDDAYWERRRKNNDAAKRSRDARRAKEDEIAIRAALLEQENLRLRVEVATLKTETARLRCLLYKT